MNKPMIGTCKDCVCEWDALVEEHNPDDPSKSNHDSTEGQLRRCDETRIVLSQRKTHMIKRNNYLFHSFTERLSRTNKFYIHLHGCSINGLFPFENLHVFVNRVRTDVVQFMDKMDAMARQNQCIINGLIPFELLHVSGLHNDVAQVIRDVTHVMLKKEREKRLDTWSLFRKVSHDDDAHMYGSALNFHGGPGEEHHKESVKVA